jgi:hypothetical protein
MLGNRELRAGGGKLVSVAKVNLRVTKWLGTVPAVGVCSNCERTFKVPLASLKSTSAAQESLRKQFVEHRCGRRDETEESNAPE